MQKANLQCFDQSSFIVNIRVFRRLMLSNGFDLQRDFSLSDL